MMQETGFGGKSLSDEDLRLEQLSDPDLALNVKLKESTKGRSAWQDKSSEGAAVKTY